MTDALLLDGQWELYSSDDHLDMNAVPFDLWDRLPADVRERGPHVVEQDGKALWVVGHRVLGGAGRFANSAIARAGLDDDGFRASTPPLRLRDMDADGVTASVIYGPSVFLGLPIEDQSCKTACWRVWNDWAAEFNGCAPERLPLLPVIPTESPSIAAAEVQRLAAAGHRGALLHVWDIRCGAREWDVLWAAGDDTGLPISFHIGAGTSRLRLDVGAGTDSWERIALGAVAPMQLDEPLAEMIFSGALERHPRLRIVLAEAGVGWLAYAIARFDQTLANRRASGYEFRMQMRPSELFARQVFATFEDEPLGPQLIPFVGADRVMWAADYPHPDSTFPHSRAAIQRSLSSMSELDRRKVTADNCKSLYGF